MVDDEGDIDDDDDDDGAQPIIVAYGHVVEVDDGESPVEAEVYGHQQQGVAEDVHRLGPPGHGTVPTWGQYTVFSSSGQREFAGQTQFVYVLVLFWKSCQKGIQNLCNDVRSRYFAQS